MDQKDSRTERRTAAVPAIGYPPALPVSARKDEILAAVRDHQVVIVAGETGSGKTTQLPKICLELGRGIAGQIGHTQPRRIAARTVAERIAEELGTPLGSQPEGAVSSVGYKVRFADRGGLDSLIKVMTDGILLAEIQRDRQLRRYDTIIIDEAHERSLNIDFILGYLKRLLPRRPDLKVIITSATIDPQRFSEHFDGAPIVEVSGRTYPVEVRYRPLVPEAEDEQQTAEEDERDQNLAICDAVDELAAEGPGDVLVFLSGEREIRDAADALGKHITRNRRLHGTEILPLYARLSTAEQHRVFQPHPGRRIVLATNVAETSLTVPGIKYVIDVGTARISRYSNRTKVQRLPIEAVSQASANQRKGRCGRTSDGVCVRLYSERDFESRPEFTDPEILRTNLAAVILQMTALGLGDLAAFPFIDPPDRRNIKDGVDLLQELGALDTSKEQQGRLTGVGRKLARLPIDPRLARMVLEADRNGCVREVLVIAAALSIQDPRERPADHQQAADEKHARFLHEHSDFIAYLNLWDYVREKQRELSGNQFRKLCKSEFLHYLRIREWQDLHSQLRQVLKELGITINPAPAAGAAPDADRIHMSMLAGLLSHIGMKDADKREYLGARNARFAIFPGSGLAKRTPRWVVAAELVETSRLWARIVAKIEPEWAEKIGGHLVRRSYSEPHWEKNQGAVMAYEKVTLYGVPIVASRKVNYGRIDQELSRELFLRHALVQGEWQTHHRFFQENLRLLDEVEELEHRARRRDILVDEETLFEFYDERIPADVVSVRHFDAWWKKTRPATPDLLSFSKAMLVNEGAGDVARTDYPDHWEQDGLRLRLSYQFEPGTDADGVTVRIPLEVLNQVDAEGFEWQVPGLRQDLVTALIRSLPKALRVNFVPAPDVAREVLARLVPREEPLYDALERVLVRRNGVRVTRDDWQLDKVPDHLRMTFRVTGDGGKTVGEGKDLDALKRRLAPKLREKLADELSTGGDSIERTGLTEWNVGTLPRLFERRRGPIEVKAYPTLVDEGESVAVRVVDSEEEQRRTMWEGTRRLLRLRLTSPAKAAQNGLSNQAKLALSHNPHGGVAKLFEDCVTCALDALIEANGGPAWDEEGFAKLHDHVRAEISDLVVEIVGMVEPILAAAHSIDRAVSANRSMALLPALTDVRKQLSELVYPGFVTGAGRSRLPDLLRYLRAVERRLERLPDDPHGDSLRMYDVERVRQRYDELVERVPPGRPIPDKVLGIRWMIEELRVSYFAQTMRTAVPVSEKRIMKAIDEAW